VRAIAATALATAALAAPGAAAAASWTEPLDITPRDGYTVYISDIAMSRHGDVAAIGETYSKPDGVVVYTSHDGGPFEGEEVNDSGGESPSICFDRRGATIVLSHKVDFGNIVRVYQRPPGGRFGREQILDSRPGDPAGIATSPAGEVLAYWTGTDTAGSTGGPVRVAVRPAGGGPFGPPQNVSERGEEAGYPYLLFDGRGNALMAWETDVGLEYATRPRGGSFGPVQLLAAAADGYAGYPDIAANRGGRAIAVWRAHPGKHNEIRAAFGTVAGRFGGSVRIGGRANRGPVLGLDAGGEALVAWRAGSYPKLPLRAAVARAGSRRFDKSQVVTRTYADLMSVAADDHGTLTMGWLDGRDVNTARHRAGKAGFVKDVVAQNARYATMGATGDGRTVIVTRTFKKHVEAVVAKPGHSFGRVREVGKVRKGETIDGPGLVTGAGGAFAWWGTGARDSDEGASWFAGSRLLP
jgi:hypothetical protein